MNQSPNPPRWADRFFRWFCADDFSEIILGDLHEMFQRRVAEEGLKKARRQFVWDVLTVLRPFALKKPFARLLDFLYFIPDMLTHYFISSFRNLRRNRAYALINIMGLTLGIICSLIVFLKIQYEVSFDNFHADDDRIFRMKRKTNQYGQTAEGAGVPTPLPKALREDFPQFENVTIINGAFASAMVGISQPDGKVKTYQEGFGKLAHVDPDYFEIFQNNWLYGNPQKALKDPFTVVLSEAFAEKYFGAEEPIGKTINIDTQYDLTVVGVVSNPPENTGFPFEMLISADLGKFSRDEGEWGSVSSSTQCYVKLKEGESREAMETLFPDFVKKHRGEEEVKHLSLFLQPLEEVHFDIKASTYAGGTTPKELLWTLGLIGVFLIITASINFVNLSTALVFRRSREVGVRKVLGSSRQQILFHFIGETALLTIFSMIIALALVPLALHLLEPYIGEGLSLNLFGNLGLWGMIFGLIVIISFLAGLYPAMLLARLEPVMAMKNRWSKKYGKGLNLRKGLIAAQFAISQVLIIGTIVMISQMDYFYSAPLGFDQESIVEVTVPREDVKGWYQMKNSLTQIPAIKDVAYSNSGASSSSTWSSNYSSSIGETLHEGQTQVKIVDRDYIDVYGIMMAAGDKEFPASDSVDRFIVNEAFVRALGIEKPEEALGVNVKIWGYDAPISGVVKDFHTVSLHKPIEPVMIWPEDEYSQLAIKMVAGADIPATIKDIEKAWMATFPERTFNYKFLDEALAEFYEDEARTLTLIQIFAVIAILIGCLGLFGLVSFMAIQRTKEIGVRKVLGASSAQIVKIFAREFFVLVIVGFFVAAPIGYYVMNQWLQDFAFQINIGPTVFAISIIFSMMIALVTVGYKSYQAATANPIEALRDE